MQSTNTTRKLPLIKHPHTLCKLVARVYMALALASCEKPEFAAPAAPGAGATNTVARKPISLADLLNDFFTAAGGTTTVSNVTADALSQPAPNLSGTRLQLHLEGKMGFEREFALDQMAPLWNNDQCNACHVGNGRSKAPQDGITPQLLFRVSIPGKGPNGGPNPVPGFGDQIQPFTVTDGVRGISVEGKVTITYVEQVRTFVDGQSYSLRQPTYTPTQPLPVNVMISPRIGPPVAGLGLLEAIPETTILALADEKDRDGDGISGRPNYVWNAAVGAIRLGRFGWKANQPTLLQQNAAAFNGDLGITTPYFPLESNVPSGGINKDSNNFVVTSTDISGQELSAVTFYTRTLGVPALRNPADPQVAKGRTIFMQANCGACHTPVMRTGKLNIKDDGNNKDWGALGVPEVADQIIAPFTDLLLHDMGPGLADNRPDFKATGSEWRTPPLWGIGLTETVNNHSFYLHDGRARNLMEAIMWHGGEAAKSAEYVGKLSQAERDALVAFLKSI